MGRLARSGGSQETEGGTLLMLTLQGRKKLKMQVQASLLAGGWGACIFLVKKEAQDQNAQRSRPPPSDWQAPPEVIRPEGVRIPRAHLRVTRWDLGLGSRSHCSSVGYLPWGPPELPPSPTNLGQKSPHQVPAQQPHLLP